MSGIRIDLALLAEYASVHPLDGRLSVVRGGLRELTFPVFPATQDRLSLAVGIEVSTEERGRPHAFLIEGAPPEDVVSKDVVAKPLDLTFTLPSDDEAGDEPGYLYLVSNMDNVAFVAPGRYRFSVTIDGLRLRDLFVDVRQEGDQVPAVALLMEGYRAYEAGRLDEAERIFQDVIQRFPTVPGGYNNLGFVQIARGRGEAALESFLKANDLDYAYPEINVANIATAMFIQGDFASALDLFDSCLRQQMFRSTGLLYGLSESGPFPVALTSAADYAALTAMNAAWSAARAHEADRAREYLEEARASVLARGTDERGLNVSRSIAALAKFLSPTSE